MRKINWLYIDSTDFVNDSYGSGGNSISASALRVCKNQFLYIGITNSSELKIGKWHKVRKYNEDIWFLPVSSKKAIERIPKGLRNFYFILCVLKNIFKIKRRGCIQQIFTRMTFILWLFAFLPKSGNIYFYAPGVRYTDFSNRHPIIGSVILHLFKKIHALALNRANTIFAAASDEEIARYKYELQKYGFKKNIKKMPTAVNTQLFYPRNKIDMRKRYNLPAHIPVFIYVGRLAKVKGISFIIDSVAEFRNRYGSCLFIIIGDGEQRRYLEEYVFKKQLSQFVIFKGNCHPVKVADYLGCSDVFLLGSYYEGFSVAMVEAVASGRPIVSTDVSGAKDLIKDGINGYIVMERDACIFAQRMYDALKLEMSAIEYSNSTVYLYDEKRLWAHIMKEILQNMQ